MNLDVIYVRIEENIKDELEQIAIDNNRSLNQEVCYIIKKYIEEERLKHIEDKLKCPVCQEFTLVEVGLNKIELLCRKCGKKFEYQKESQKLIEQKKED